MIDDSGFVELEISSSTGPEMVLLKKESVFAVSQDARGVWVTCENGDSYLVSSHSYDSLVDIFAPGVARCRDAQIDKLFDEIEGA